MEDNFNDFLGKKYKTYKVFLKGKLIDAASAEMGLSTEEARQELIKKQGFDPNIEIIDESLFPMTHIELLGLEKLWKKENKEED
jgi:hypothetical protein